MSPQKHLNPIFRYTARAVIVLALVGMGFAFAPKWKQFNDYQETKIELEKEIRVEEKRIQDLRLNQERFATDKYFVQKIAHEIGFAHEGETIYQFEKPSQTNLDTRPNNP